jgi:hypothetical protein
MKPPIPKFEFHDIVEVKARYWGEPKGQGIVTNARKTKHGYLMVRMDKDGKEYAVHYSCLTFVHRQPRSDKSSASRSNNHQP